MMWRRKFSDREFVERTAQYENRWRRRLAIILVLGSLLYLGLAVWFYRLVSSGIYPIQEELFDQTHRDWFETGLLMGFFGGKFFYFATFTLVFGAYYLTSYSGREHRLLIKLFERLDQLGQLDQNGQIISEHQG